VRLVEHRLDLLDRIQRLGHDEMGARGQLALEAVPLGRRLGRRRVEGAGDREPRPLADRGPGRVLGAVETDEDLDQADRIDIPDARPGRVVTDPGRIAGQGDDVPDPQGVRAEQLRLERHQVPVAGRAMDEALEIEVVLDRECDRQRAHPDPGHRRVGHVDDVDAGVAQEPRRLDRPIDPDAPRRVDLDRHDEAACVKELGETSRGWLGVTGPTRRPFDQRGPGAPGVDHARGLRGGGRLAGGCTGRQERIQRGSHLGDVLGRRSAAAADDPCPGRQQPRRHRAEIRRAGCVDEAAIEPLRQPGVRHDRSRGLSFCRAAHRFEGVETGNRSGPAIDADRVRPGRGEGLGRGRRAAAICQAELLAEGQRRDDRHIRSQARLVDRQDELVEVREGLENDHVTAALEQPFDLLAEHGPHRCLGHRRHAPRRRAERADGAADQCLAPADLARLAGKACGATVEVADAALEAPRGQPMPVGTERQGLDQLRPRLQVFTMGGADHLRLTRDELFETRALGHSPTEQEGAHAAVDEQRASRQTVAEARPRQAGRGIGHQRVGVRRGSVGKVSGSLMSSGTRHAGGWIGRSRPENGKTLPAGRVQGEVPYRAGEPARNWHLAGATPVGCRGFNGPVPPPLWISRLQLWSAWCQRQPQ
jgi:hypothetical protein